MYDGIVLGVGGFGSGAFDHLARRGVRVLGIERFDVAHDRGSSHGETRIIRKAYFEHADYVPLLLRAYDQWRDLERDAGRRLLHPVGLLIAGPPDGEAVPGARAARRRHGVPLEEISCDDAARRFPGFRIPEGFETVFEPDAGYLEVEACVRAHIERGVRHGGMLRTGETVLSWTSDGRTVRVETDRGRYEAGFLIITAGAWAPALLGDLALPLEIVRKPLFWFGAPSRVYDEAAGSPAFYFEVPEGAFYGFPSTDGVTVKVAEHTGGSPVRDPLALDRSLRADDPAATARFVEQCLPQLARVPARHSVCMYTLTPDRHFVVDRHPEWANVALGAGFSGHGFKFTNVLGEALADLAMRGATDLPVGFLSLTRPAMRPSPT